MAAGAPLLVTSTNSEEDSSNEAGSSIGGDASIRHEPAHLHHQYQHYRPFPVNGAVHAQYITRPFKIQRHNGPTLDAAAAAAASASGPMPATS
jgi:hypothetical protein